MNWWLPVFIGCGCVACGDVSRPGSRAKPLPPAVVAVEGAEVDPLPSLAGQEAAIVDWPSALPQDVALDSAKLDEAAQVAEGDGSYCLLVIRHGKLAYERYFNGSDANTPHKSWSLAKSYSSTLVGIAIDRGDLKIDDDVATHVPDWLGSPRQSITVRDLVSMTSGLQWSAFQDYVEMATLAPDRTQFAIGLPSSDPAGSKWIYHNGAVQMLEPIFRQATGMTIENYAQKYLWSKIGMAATWDHDLAGHPTPYANVLATCRDHARLGYLYLHHGRWGQEQVVSASWVAQATTPSQSFNRAYGYLFWLNGETPAMDAMMQPWPDRPVPFAPTDMFAARGFGNQFIDVIPSLDLIVVRFGVDPLNDLGSLATDARFEKHDEILRPILEAVR
jgi:CubicO group peptidase (beta-lactamase class C family)